MHRGMGCLSDMTRRQARGDDDRRLGSYSRASRSPLDAVERLNSLGGKERRGRGADEQAPMRFRVRGILCMAL